MKCKHGIYGCVTCYLDEVENALKGNKMTKPTTVNAKILIEMVAPKLVTIFCIKFFNYNDCDIKELHDEINKLDNDGYESKWLRKNFPWCFEEKTKRYRNKIAFPYEGTVIEKGIMWTKKDNMYWSENEYENLFVPQVENNPDLFEEVK